MRADVTWPAYFAAKPMKGRRVSYKAGDQFELQTKEYIRSLGINYGVKDAATRPFADLPYVKTLNVASTGLRAQVLARRLDFASAAQFVGGGEADA